MLERWIGLTWKELIIGGISLLALLYLIQESQAISSMTPWDNRPSMQTLVYGMSTVGDVVNAVGEYPDEIIRSQQIYPVVENHYYYDKYGTGAATVFVFENGMLVGMHYKGSNNQLIDLTYFLTDNGDRQRNYPLNMGFRGYYPNFPLYSFY